MLLPTRAVAQGALPLRVSFGGGLLVGDSKHDQLGSTGVGAFVRAAGWPGAPVAGALELSFQHLPRGRIFTPPGCPITTLCLSTADQTGAATILTLSPMVELRERSGSATLLYHLGPTLHWLVDRAPGSTAVALGARAGITLRLSRGESGFLIAADLIKPFRGSDAPRWLVPLTVGWEL